MGFASSSLHYHEPRMFPGVVSSRRRSSVSKVSGFTNPTWDGEGDMKTSTGSLKRDADAGGLEKKDTIEEAAEESEGP